MIGFYVEHPRGSKKSTTLTAVAEYPPVFFNHCINPLLPDLILHYVEAEQRQANVVHHINQADQVSALLTGDKLVAWLHSAGA